MMCFKKSFLFLIVTIELCNAKSISNAEDEEELIFAHVIYRHGNRTLHADDRFNIDDPRFIQTYKNDPYRKISFWTEGLDELTNTGKQVQFELGQFMRRRYADLIGPGYSPEKVYIRSTDVDRTLMSALTNAAGLFEPSGNQVWHESMNWQPVPIHTIPFAEDYLLNQAVPCDETDRMLDEYLRSEELQDILNEYSDLARYLEEHSGSEVQTVEDFYIFFDALNIEKALGLSLPDWADKVLQTSNHILEYLSVVYYDAIVHTNEMKKARAGFLMRELFERFRDKAMSRLNPDRSLWIYSAHDDSIFALLSGLNIPQTILPPFASSVHLEMYDNGLEYYVQLFYRIDRSEYMPPIDIPNCGIRCPLDRLFELYGDILPTENETFESICLLT